MNCDICSFPLYKPVKSLLALPSITSDCRSWSEGRSVQVCSGCGVSHRWVLSRIAFDSIYHNYHSYPEAAGRTSKILQFIKYKMPVPESILDIGTGMGNGLRDLANYFPNAVVVGFEPNSDNPEILNERPERKFDLITLFHVLEHVEDINEMLSYIKKSLTDNGRVLVQVPYAPLWPFDLVIADHIWHFTHTSLLKLFGNHGFQVHYIGNDAVKKEWTLLAGIGESVSSSYNDIPIKDSIGWLLKYKACLNHVHEPVAVYGTGPAAAWTGNIIGDKVACYLDDDTARQQSYFNGKKVMPSFRCDFPVIAPFADWQLAEIKSKNPSLRFYA